MALKENYKDDILDVSVNTKRKYRMTENPDGTISLDDETVYTQEGDSFGATDLNAMAHAINNTSSDAEHTSYDNTTSGLISDNVQGAIDEINDNLTASNQTAGVTNVPFRFGCTDDGEFGYIINQGGADTVIPFSGKDDLIRFNFYREYGISSESMMLYITDAGYFPSNESSPLFTVSKTCVSTSELFIATITLTANKATTIKFKIDYTEEGKDSNVNYRASIEIKHNNTDILTKHKEPETATSNTIEQNITLALNDTITLNFYAAYGSWFGNIIVK